MFRAFYCLCLSCLVGGATPAVAVDAREPDYACPVKPERLARSAHKTLYQGRLIHFCCDECVEKFNANPQAYLSRVPPLKVGDTALSRNWSTAKLLADAIRLADAHQPLLVYYLLVFILTAIALYSRRRTRRAAKPGDGIMPPLTSFAVVLNLLLVGLVLELIRPPLPWEERFKLVTDKAAALAGRMPAQFGRLHEEMVRDLLAQEGETPLKRTYYRGNDERNAGLFNGGRYRTCTLHVSIRSDEGKELSPNDAVAGNKLVACLEIVRAPNTADGMFSDELMSRYFMIRYGDGFASNESGLSAGATSLEPGKRWEYVFPLSDQPLQESQRLAGLLLVGERQAGSDARLNSVHYWISYDLKIEAGRLAWSQLVMGAALNPIPQFPGEWFSEQPIPEIPTPAKGEDKPRETYQTIAGLSHENTFFMIAVQLGVRFRQ